MRLARRQRCASRRCGRARNRQLAETAIRPWTPAFIHGDLQLALYDLATLTLAHEERLDDVIAGYEADVDRDLIRA